MRKVGMTAPLPPQGENQKPKREKGSKRPEREDA